MPRFFRLICRSETCRYPPSRPSSSRVKKCSFVRPFRDYFVTSVVAGLRRRAIVAEAALPKTFVLCNRCVRFEVSEVSVQVSSGEVRAAVVVAALLYSVVDTQSVAGVSAAASYTAELCDVLPLVPRCVLQVGCSLTSVRFLGAVVRAPSA